MERRCRNCFKAIAEENPLPFCDFDCEMDFEAAELNAALTYREMDEMDGFTHETDSNYKSIGNY